MSMLALIVSLLAMTFQAPPLSGDYVEVRTVSVFAGPCHYNGETMTGDRDAVLAWQFDSGVRVMAAISSQANLADGTAARTSEIVIDSSAGKSRTDAALTCILSHDGAVLGKIVSIRPGAISFNHENREYQVSSPGFATLDVQGMPNDECCKQPNLVWYEPLVKLQGRKVGYTVDAHYVSDKVSDEWERMDENGAFYGKFVY